MNLKVPFSNAKEKGDCDSFVKLSLIAKKTLVFNVKHAKRTARKERKGDLMY
jgi:hypothetical protein